MAIGEPPIVLMVLDRARPARDESRGPRAGPAQMAEATRTAVAHTFSAHSVTLGARAPGALRSHLLYPSSYLRQTIHIKWL